MEAKTDFSTRAEVLLAETLGMLQPLARLLVENGVGYAQFAQALKPVFMDAARAALLAQGSRVTDSAVSVLSGVHRKEVRASATAERAKPRALSLAAEAFTLWTHEPAYCTPDGAPQVLPRSGPAPSFEALAAQVSKDFHARALLDELIRLGLARIDADDRIVLVADAFVPRRDFSEMAFFFGANLRDHLAAGAANLRASVAGGPPPFLEQAVFADGLTPESARALGEIGRALWKDAFDAMVDAATTRCAADAAAGGRERVRFGAYFFSEAGNGSEPADAPAHNDTAPINQGPGNDGPDNGGPSGPAQY